jgi:threonine/homoserine/homoserine lactone efflux protein
LWALTTAAWCLLFTWAVDRGRSFVSAPAMHRRLQATTGAVLVLLGAAVVAGP